MSILLGQALNGRELEKEVSSWSGDQFANLCDSLVWAVSSQTRTTVPSFSPVVNAPDGGVDAEYCVEVARPVGSHEPHLIGAGWNAFQYKKRDVFASDRKRIVAGLKTQLKGALAYIEEKSGRKPDRYILCVSVNLDHREKRLLREAILSGFKAPEAFPDPVILGAQELAQLLNDSPHLRAGYFQPMNFRTWQEAYRAHKRKKFLERSVELQGRVQILSRVRALIEDPNVRVVALWGLHDVGKSRLALEATCGRMDAVVVAADVENLTAGDMRALVSHRETICIAEDPAVRQVDALIDEALSEPNLKVLLTIPSPYHASGPLYGADTRVQHVEVTPLDRDETHRLIRAASPNLPFEIEDWIADKSKGLPGIILAAVVIGEGLRTSAADFETHVGEEFGKRLIAQFGEKGLETTRLLALLTQVGVAGRVAEEAGLIRELLGDGLTPYQFSDSIRHLSVAGVLVNRGSYVEVAIPLLANHLAGQLLHTVEKRNATWALFSRLGDTGRARLLRRLGQLEERLAEWFWNAAFGEDGLFCGGNILKNSAALYLVAGAVPGRTLTALSGLLEGMSLREREGIRGNERRNFVYALEQLLFRMGTSHGALKLLGLLAEAENESYANNATGVFAECFIPTHPQLPLPLEQRLRVLQEFLNRDEIGGRRVALGAIDAGLHGGGGAVLVRHSEGTAPFDGPPSITYAELWRYLQALMESAWTISKGEDEIATKTLAKLPEFAGRLGLSSGPHLSVEWFERLTKWATDPDPRVDVSELSGTLKRVIRSTQDRKRRVPIGPEVSKELEQTELALERLERSLSDADFSVRLRQWAGGRGSILSDGETTSALEAMADEVLEHPDLMTEGLWTWLNSPGAWRSPRFFHVLGTKDINGIFQARVESWAARPEGADAFSSYWRGLAQREFSHAERRLDKLASRSAVDGKAIVLATWKMPATPSAVERIVNQLRAGRVPPEFVAGVVGVGGWLKPIAPEAGEVLFREIAREDLRNGSLVIELLHMWLYLQKPLGRSLEELAWQILESNPKKSTTDGWHFDQLAAHLATSDSERGFNLLKQLAGEDGDGKWEPIEGHGENRFWSTLLSADKIRAIDILLKAGRNRSSGFRWQWALKGQLLPSRDREAILALGRETIENARFLAGCLVIDNDFWRLAGELLALYPEDDDLWFEIAGVIEGVNEVITGPRSAYLEGRKRQVKDALTDSRTSAIFRQRLVEWLDRAEDRIGEHVVWEYDRDIDGLMDQVHDRNSSQRIWAIGRILKYASLEEIRRLLTVEDIREALPNVDLAERRRKILESAIEVWERVG